MTPDVAEAISAALAAGGLFSDTNTRATHLLQEYGPKETRLDRNGRPQLVSLEPRNLEQIADTTRRIRDALQRIPEEGLSLTGFSDGQVTSALDVARLDVVICWLMVEAVWPTTSPPRPTIQTRENAHPALTQLLRWIANIEQQPVSGDAPAVVSSETLGAGLSTDERKPKVIEKKPSKPRIKRIIDVILTAGKALPAKTIGSRMLLGKNGGSALRRDLRWMSQNGILTKEQGQGYWPVGYQLPNSDRAT